MREALDKPVIIVESPTKVKTVKKYAGDGYNVTSTSGHLKDLPPNELGIDIENGFTPKYVNIKGKQKIIRNLKSSVGDAKDIYLAPDPDREGEAIAFHVADLLKKKGRRFHRVLFHELTKNGIQKGLESPTELNKSRYDAQQARRILDRLVGYQISPLLWRKVKNGLSAGRVQSVAVRLICDREREIFAFKPKEYWSITATLEGKAPPPFEARLAKKSGRAVEIKNEKEASRIVEELSGQTWAIEKIIKRTVKRNPLPPFITSKLQQEAIRKLGFSAKKTMVVAQQLYEGIDLGPGEPVGLITYMRTDSTRIAPEAAQEAVAFIRQRFGSEYGIEKPRFFPNKNKAQDAHEAIRPTSVLNEPDKVKPFLSKDQLALYELIWKRFVASQMSQAQIDQKTISIRAGDYLFSATGSTMRFDGFLKLYRAEDDNNGLSDRSATLPELSENDEVRLIKLDPKQHFTTPPPRFTEASLVKELEERGIGRPSTYATILSTIRDKGYVEMVNKSFKPTELGFIVNDLLVESFPDILDVEFTANLENDLDSIESDRIKSTALLEKFYKPFSKRLEEADEKMRSVKGVGVDTDLKCPSCGKDLKIKIGKNGPFLACSAYPECSFSSNYRRAENGSVELIEPDHSAAKGLKCPKCGNPMVVKQGRYGDFLACSAYPECKHTQSMNSSNGTKSIGIKCPKQGCEGDVVEKTTRRGKTFYGCSNFPDCDFASWDKPVNMECPKCNSPFLVEKTTKKDGTVIKCAASGCNFKQKV